jgi:hypothetical protein
MSTSNSFSIFLDNIKVDDADSINQRYREITKKLNKTFRYTDSETDNSLQVGSYGRYTGIKGISDLDMLYIMPKSKWDDYKNDPAGLLNDTKKALEKRYPTTDITYDRLVVDVKFSNFTFEVQPVFECIGDDDFINYKYPDTKYNTYKITKPKQEQHAMTEFKNNHGKHHRLLSKMVRSWKNNVGVGMGGLLIDTFAYNFLINNNIYDWAKTSRFDEMCRDFFAYLKDQSPQDHYQALGSNQDVKVKHPFLNKAKEAYKKACGAIKEDDESKKNDAWRDIFGRNFPKAAISSNESVRSCSSLGYTNTEEFIEDKYSVDVRYNASIDATVTQKGFRPHLLSFFLEHLMPLKHGRILDFEIKTDCSLPYVVKWKVRNVGLIAERRNCIRGNIIDSNRYRNVRHESADFDGPHYVEGYIIKDGVVVARDRIDVPIKEKNEEK